MSDKSLFLILKALGADSSPLPLPLPLPSLQLRFAAWLPLICYLTYTSSVYIFELESFKFCLGGKKWFRKWIRGLHHLVVVVVVLLSNKSDKHLSDWCFLATKKRLTMAKDPQANLFEGKNNIQNRKKLWWYYSCNKITTTQIQISRQNSNGFF